MAPNINLITLNSPLSTISMDKYPGWSPYNYVMGNTLNSFDPDGRDVIVLRAPKGAHGAGHAALLIGSEKNGWVYISKNGVEGEEKAANGKPAITKLTQRKGETFNQFLSVIEAVDEQDYKLGFWMITGTDDDDKMFDAAENNANELYELFTNNCIDVVTKALESIELHGGYSEKTIIGKDGKVVAQYKDYTAIPNIRYEIIKANNVGFELILSDDTVYKRKKAEAGLE